MAERPARYQPYQAADGSVRLVDSVVLSLDLLGTRAGAAEEALKYLEVTRHALDRANQWAEGGTASHTVVRWFSDNLALADPLALDDPHSLTFGFHLITAGWMQLELALAGVFARGGMAHGLFFADETFVYGPALVEAYELESRIAIYPRVVLTHGLGAFAEEELARFGGGDTEVHRKLLAVDRDGVLFVNYLQSVFDEPDDVVAMLCEHKTNVETRLDEHRGNPAVHLKYSWLADYHDRFCRSNFPPAHRGELMIGTVEGTHLTPFGEAVPKPEPPPHTGLPF